MYRSTHSFEGQGGHTLSFDFGESFCVVEKSNDSWWLACNSQGKVGYVPKNYLQKEQGDSDIVLQSINNAIEEIIASAPAGQIQPQQQTVLKKLMSHKESLSTSQKSRQGSSKRQAPPPPVPKADQSNSVSSREKERNPPPVPQRQNIDDQSSIQSDEPTALPAANTVNSRMSNTDCTSPITHDVPDELGSDLLNIFKTLNSSESKCRSALSVVILTMKSSIPSLDKVFEDILKTVPIESANEESAQLSLALENMREIKNDAQQRNWAIEDDEGKIEEILLEILSELTTIDKKFSISTLSHDDSLPILTLVEYHQMETRVALRLVILQIFGVICSLSKSFVSTLLTTVLPLELAMDLMTHTTDTQRTCYSALVLTMLFSTGEPIPFGHYERLDKSFVQFLINYIEDTESDDQVSEMFLNVILSFNLHMQNPSDNIIMQVISEKGTCTELSEKIMMLINRGNDPVVMEEHWTENDDLKPPSSVMKFLQDIFSQKSTSGFLYTNDMNVLIDITTRNLTDLPSGNKMRTEYLDLLLNIVTNTNYSENRHRAIDIGNCLSRILEEEQPDTDAERQVLDFDKRIISKIIEDFEHLFT